MKSELRTQNSELKILKSIRLLALLAGFLFLCGGVEGRAAEPGGKIYRIVVESRCDFLKLAEHYRPLTDYLFEQTGERFEVFCPLLPSRFLALVEEVDADFSLQNGWLFLSLVRNRGARVLVRSLSASGNSLERGVIIARRDSRISFPEQLKGRLIGLSSVKSVSGFLAQAQVCKKYGLPAGSLRLALLPPGEEELVKKVLSGALSAAFLPQEVYASLKKRFPRGNLVEVATTEAFPAGCMAAFRGTDPKVALKVQKALLHLSNRTPRGGKILSSLGVGGFIPGTAEDYRPLGSL